MQKCPCVAVKAFRGRRGTTPLIRSFGARRIFVVSFLSQSLHSLRKKPKLPPQYESRCAPGEVWNFGEKKNLLSLLGCE